MIAVDHRTHIGIIRGRKVPSYSAVTHHLFNAGRTYQVRSAVIDSNLVTERIPQDLAEVIDPVTKSIVAHYAQPTTQSTASGSISNCISYRFTGERTTMRERSAQCKSILLDV